MSIYQHFRNDEKGFIDQVLQWKENVEITYVEKLTDFLDPREQHIVQAVIGSNSDVKCSFFGGSPNSERKRALIHYDYLQVNNDDFKITLFQVNYPVKFATISHRDVLGSLMGLKLRRGKFGDILINDFEVQFFSTAEMDDFIKMELTSIGRSSVSIKEISLNDLITDDEKWKERTINSSSLRLDTVVSSLHNLSRQKSQTAIQKGYVKVNWKLVDDGAFLCDVNDVISVRGLGRAKVISLNGTTRKGRYILNVGFKK